MKVIAITGPAGVGKSTVAGKLAKQFRKCANIDADHIKHMLVSAFSYDLNADGTKRWSFNDWVLVGESIGMLANKFQQARYDVIINGYIDEAAWDKIQKQINITHKFLLLPSLDTTKYRDKQRPDDQPMGSQMVAEHYNYFSTANFYHDFVKLDTTTQEVEETVGIIEKILE